MDPIAQTAYGKLKGAKENGVYVFKGVPYAQAERFMAPQPPTSWAGVRDALSFGPVAPQSDPSGIRRSSTIYAKLSSGRPATPRPAAPESEECQSLNIWTPGLRDAGKRAVMVWLHPGFFASGSGGGVDGAPLAAQRNVVVVSLNHRLNVFGHAFLSDIGDEFSDAANTGLLDIIAALKWIQDNIEQFGGDPHRVMVFGCSGGGMKTSFLLENVQARDLFHRACVQSGPVLNGMDPEKAAEATGRLLYALKIKPADIGQLRTLPMERLLAAYHQAAAEMPAKNFTDLSCFAPVIDGVHLKQRPLSPAAQKLIGKIPLLIGCNTDEMTFFAGDDPDAFSLTRDHALSRLATIAGDDAAPILNLYEQSMPDATASEQYFRAFSDYSVAMPTLFAARREAEKRPVFLYNFGEPSLALNGALGATHTMETPLIFGSFFEKSPLHEPSRAWRMLSDMMMTAWTSFAETGAPATSPDWSLFNGSQPSIMRFSGTPQPGVLSSISLHDAWAPHIDA